jgi:hypothetical protein
MARKRSLPDGRQFVFINYGTVNVYGSEWVGSSNESGESNADVKRIVSSPNQSNKRRNIFRDALEIGANILTVWFTLTSSQFAALAQNAALTFVCILAKLFA